MSSGLKGIVHSLLSVLAVGLAALIPMTPALNLTLGSLLSMLLNWILSRYVPTTTGASARQGIREVQNDDGSWSKVSPR